jgi:two-component system, OmpR family, sensor histidine kinase KdpD
VLAVAAVTAAISLFRGITPVLSLGVLYLFAVLPIAIVWGSAYAIPVAVASMLAFNWFHLPPQHSFSLADRENWFALAVYLVVAVVVSELAARARRRAAEAEQRERETAVLAELSTAFLQPGGIEAELERAGARTAEVLGVESARIELGPPRDPPRAESPLELRAAGERIGTLYVKEGREPNLEIRRRFLPALSSLLAVASDRERLGREALEAEALRRSDTIKTAVLRAVSHDLRSPLTAIRVAVEGLESPELELGTGDRESLLETIRLESARLDRLVENLLDLSRLQAGAAPPTPELWPVDQLVAQALDELGDQTDRVSVELPGDLPPVKVDPIHAQRILVNLLDNALKFSGPTEPVSVRGTRTRRDVILRVVDRGPGIPADQLEPIFEPFHRVSGRSDRRGAGLGLAIARGFAEANGGRVWAESRPEQGASFALALPAEQRAQG